MKSKQGKNTIISVSMTPKELANLAKEMSSSGHSRTRVVSQAIEVYLAQGGELAYAELRLSRLRENIKDALNA